MGVDLAAEKPDTSFQLFHFVHAVLDADPVVETCGAQLPEDRIVVVHTVPDLAVSESLCAALRTSLLSPQVIERVCSSCVLSFRGSASS